ncbi:MAG: hypothetical protein U0174_11640 [Polyangiaceae bacterium]
MTRAHPSLWLALANVAVLTLACDKKPTGEATQASTSAKPLSAGGGTPIGVRSCRHPDLCLEWQKLTPAELFDARSECNDSEGRFASTPCPKEHALASCSHESGGASVYLYGAPGLDLGNAETECKKTQGTFMRLGTPPAASPPTSTSTSRPTSPVGPQADGGH